MGKTLALTSILFLSATSLAFGEGAATPTDRGADIEVHQSHNGTSVDISASVGSGGTSGTGAVTSDKAKAGQIGPRDH